jgi:hypothetical protein
MDSASPHLTAPHHLTACTQAAAGDLATKAKLPARLTMMVTEYNVMERAGPLHLTWAHALFIAAVRYTPLDRNLRSRMPLIPTPARLKLLHVCDK